MRASFSPTDAHVNGLWAAGQSRPTAGPASRRASVDLGPRGFRVRVDMDRKAFEEVEAERAGPPPPQLLLLSLE
ncbi:hypothetical protein BE04_50165 [Sorangium cellulosum]|uniref:Uncharacterized protein n=1 Tax=Sorangium cellulosum TaxID=56 RepID=A0A150P5M6_SORCE|nr:hypothetical protein BE04_50165 [Sorangium cellulosum]